MESIRREQAELKMKTKEHLEAFQSANTTHILNRSSLKTAQLGCNPSTSFGTEGSLAKTPAQTRIWDTILDMHKDIETRKEQVNSRDEKIEGMHEIRMALAMQTAHWEDIVKTQKCNNCSGCTLF